LHVGIQGTGTVAISGGMLSSATVSLAEQPGSTGILNISGGTTIVTASLTLVDCTGSAASVTGGALYVTNASQSAVLDVAGGTFTLNGGALVVDTLILTNPCGRFVYNSGTLLYNQLVLPARTPALVLRIAVNQKLSTVTLS